MDDDDRKAFERATRDVRPLKPSNRATSTRTLPKPEARLSRAARDFTLKQSLDDPRAEQSAEEIAFRSPNISERTFRKLRRGRFSIEDEIDLHGLTRAEARLELKRFLGDCADRGLGCVRVVHGKGARSGPDGPVLKAHVQYWLAQWEEVLAFVSASRRHGGSGAVYVLLGRK